MTTNTRPTTTQLLSVQKLSRPYPTRFNRIKRSEYTAKPRLYFSPDGETILDNLINRRSRPVDVYRRVLPQALTLLGLPPDTKASWSQKAGCSCGCSPAFILTIPHLHHSAYARWDAWATVTQPRGE